MASNIRIVGMGLHLPEAVRTNAWWPEEIVETWRAKQVASNAKNEELLLQNPPLPQRKTLEAFRALKDDPFQGSRERRIAADNVNASEMEALAATEAIKAAGIRPTDVDLLLTYTMIPDYLTVNPAAIVHRKAGLRTNCFSIHCDGICSSFLTQLCVASQFIGNGTAKYALLVQSSLGSRITRREEPHSAWLGDGASAQVVALGKEGRGLLSFAHRTDGDYHRAFMCGVPGHNWYDEGRVVAYSEDAKGSHRMILRSAECAADVVQDALSQAKVDPSQVAFYASHQPSSWFREITQEAAGLTAAKSAVTFPKYASIGASNIPAQLMHGVQERKIADGDVIAMFAVSSGMTWSGVALRWG